MKTSELTGHALDWAVAKCEGATDFWYDTIATYWVTLDGKDRALRSGWAQSYLPSIEWAQGGPIVEREKLCVGYKHQADRPINNPATTCWARTTAGGYLSHGPTPLIAAMRCYVASKLGDNVEIPEKENDE